jgi:hypothetical protein
MPINHHLAAPLAAQAESERLEGAVAEAARRQQQLQGDLEVGGGSPRGSAAGVGKCCSTARRSAAGGLRAPPPPPPHTHTHTHTHLLVFLAAHPSLLLPFPLTSTPLLALLRAYRRSFPLSTSLFLSPAPQLASKDAKDATHREVEALGQLEKATQVRAAPRWVGVWPRAAWGGPAQPVAAAARGV